MGGLRTGLASLSISCQKINHLVAHSEEVASSFPFTWVAVPGLQN